MRIASISISRFRSIMDAESIQLGDLTILIGKNNEGKSNIIKAVTLALEAIQAFGATGNDRVFLGRSGYSWDKDFPIQLREDSKKSRKSRFRIDFLLTDDEVGEFKNIIKSNINNFLPVEIQIGPENRLEFKVIKQGPGATALAKKSKSVAQFISRRISMDHIPAVRTEGDALSVINSMVRRPLQEIESHAAYRKAVDKIRELQKPVLDRVAQDISVSLKQYVPAIRSVQIDTSVGRIYRGLKSEIDLVIDDGAPTSIEFKGDGIKSLVALSLAQRANDDDSVHIVAIEEPESHLHPGAVHELRQVVSDLAKKGQVIVSTHNPIFVDRNSLATTVLVEAGKARRARDVEMIREALGVKVSDNLLSAEYCVIVEGVSDAVILSELFSSMDQNLAKMISRGEIIFEPLNGAAKLDYKLGLVRHAMTAFHVVLDNDPEGQGAVDRAIDKAQLGHSEYHLLSVRGSDPAELEDCILQEKVASGLAEAFGGTWDRLPGKGKWSDRMSSAVRQAGKRWNTETERTAKQVYVDAVRREGRAALTGNARTLLNGIARDIRSYFDRID